LLYLPNFIVSINDKKIDKMKIIISCCDRKNGGPLIHNGEVINFVSHVDQVVPNDEMYFHPDDLVPNDLITWRELVSQQGQNNYLQPAYELYKPPIYNSLYQNYGNDLFIFSAGWGIVRADYKLPKYNVTFAKGKNVPKSAKRYRNDCFHDFNHLESKDNRTDEEIVLIAPKDYVTPFCQLTNNLQNKKIIFYFGDEIKSKFINKPDFEFRKIPFITNNNRKWHYELAQLLIKNEIAI
jgi:hypothetical protein